MPEDNNALNIRISKEDLDKAAKEIENDDTQIGYYTRKKAQDIDHYKSLAANYFTSNKLEEIQKKSVNLLKMNDLDLEKLKGIFSDANKIELQHIQFLLERMESIEKIENTSNANLKKNRSFFADLFLKGGDTNNG